MNTDERNGEPERRMCSAYAAYSFVQSRRPDGARVGRIRRTSAASGVSGPTPRGTAAQDWTRQTVGKAFT